MVLRHRLRVGQHGTPRPVKGGYFPVPPTDTLADIRNAMVLALEQQGVECEVHHHEVARWARTRSARASRRSCSAPTGCRSSSTRWNTAASYGKTATFMPKPVVGDNGSGMHCHQSIWKGGKNLFAGNGYAGLSDRAALHRRHHQARQGAQRDHQPGHELVQAPGAGLRGADQPRLLGAQPLGRLPHPVRIEPQRPPRGGALPDPTAERLSRVRRDADGGPGRRAEQDPSRRPDRQGHVPPAAGRGREGAARVRSLEEALGCLRDDHASSRAAACSRRTSSSPMSSSRSRSSPASA